MTPDIAASPDAFSCRPLVSVVTPVLNALGPLQQCIASVLAQDYPRIEHIVIDGGSSDGTVAMMREYSTSQEPSNFRFISRPDVGVYDAMVRGVNEARGEYVHILNADDRYVDAAVISRVIQRMELNGLDLHHARARFVESADGSVIVIGRDVGRRALTKKMWVAHPTVVVRRSVYEEFGSFSIGYRLAGDHEFLLRVWDHVRVGFSDEVQVEMLYGGLSTRPANVRTAYRESAAAAVLHGRHPLLASGRFLYEVGKARIVPQSVWRALRRRREPPSGIGTLGS